MGNKNIGRRYISVICVYNDKNSFETQLCASLKIQNVEYELVALDNTNNRFKSAAAALNYGSSIATGNVFIYAHQDIFLKGENELRRFADAIENVPNGTVVGTQGVKEPSRLYYSNITAGNTYISDINREFEDGYYQVSCVDEGFFGMKKETWTLLNFNETLCDNWHLYCVEMCLHTRKLGNKVYVYPIQLHHFSMGTISLDYMRNLKQLCKFYRKDFKYIWTTCYKVRTNAIYINTLVSLWHLNRLIRNKLK